MAIDPEEFFVKLAELNLPKALSRARQTVFVADAGFARKLASLAGDLQIVGIDDFLSRRARLPVLAWRVVVCVVEGEAERLAAVRARVRRPVYGLMADLLPNAMAKRRLFARPAAPPRSPKRRYAIVCLPRSGSQNLCSALAGMGLGRPDEHLRSYFGYLLLHRAETGLRLDRYYRALVDAEPGEVFGTKIIDGYVSGIEGLLLAEERDYFMKELASAKIVFLRRQSKVDQAVSEFIANRVRVWHLWQHTDEAQYEAKVRDLEYDSAALLKIHADLVAREENLGLFLSRNVAPENLYQCELEALAKAPAAGLPALYAFITGRQPASVPHDYGERPPTRTEVHQAFAARLSEDLAASGK